MVAAVWIDIDVHSGVPLNVQIAEQVRRAIETGTLRSGERLPTVRRLARELSVAPNTIVKAYGGLQRLGLIESRPGVGTVVAEGVEEVARERRVEKIFERSRALVRDAVALSMSEDDLWASLDAEFERIRRGAGEGPALPG